MPDLKAAAELMLDAASASAEEVKLFPHGEWHDRAEHERASFLLAAQALEALAWQAESGASVRQMCSGGFSCAVTCDEIVNNYYADTPLGAILAAMEGEVPNDRG